MTVKLQFVYGGGFSSKAIAWFSSGSGRQILSHVDAVFDDGTLYGARSDKVGGQPAGVYTRRANYEPWPNRVLIELPATDVQKRDWLKFLRAQYALPYDHMAILGFVSGRAWREEDSWICSELLARALEVSGIVEPLYLSASRITPIALALLCSAIPGRVITGVEGS